MGQFILFNISWFGTNQKGLGNKNKTISAAKSVVVRVAHKYVMHVTACSRISEI